VTGPRARAYGRVIRTLRDVGAAKLLVSEQARIRHAADALLFCADVVEDAAARAAVSDIQTLRDHLVESGRWTSERAGDLADDVWACGPGLASVPVAAAA
jgi:hypothetical protein